MALPFHVTVATVAETLFEGEALSLTLPGTDGVLTILAKHEPFITTLKEGTASIEIPSGDTQTFAVTGGVLEVSNSQAVVLL